MSTTPRSKSGVQRQIIQDPIHVFTDSAIAPTAGTEPPAISFQANHTIIETYLANMLLADTIIILIAFSATQLDYREIYKENCNHHRLGNLKDLRIFKQMHL